MNAYRRVNIDGKSVTETRLANAAIKPGMVAVMNSSDKFVVGNAGRIYAIHPANHQGLTIADDVPAGDSAVGEYIEEGRELVFRIEGSVTIKKDDPIHIASTGKAGPVPSAAGTYAVVGYAQDNLTVASAAVDFLRVRIRAGSVTKS